MPVRSRRSPRGFSLLELVLAMVVGLVVLFLGMAGYARLVDSAAIDAGGQMVNDLLTEARQDAVSQNTAVEVRLYDTTPAPGQPTAYGSLQLRWMRSDGTTPPASPLLVLPQAAVIDATPSHSSLVTLNAETPTADPTDPRIDALTRSFHFLPDGSTDLAASGKWLLTLRALAQSNPARFPANWACVEIDPVTGRAQLYRP
jgi:uncharacterized protein (TIGR02596 family)